MIDFIFKMLQDKPSIVYIEDPLASSEKAAWKKFIVKTLLLRQKFEIPNQQRTLKSGQEVESS